MPWVIRVGYCGPDLFEYKYISFGKIISLVIVVVCMNFPEDRDVDKISYLSTKFEFD